MKADPPTAFYELCDVIYRASTAICPEGSTALAADVCDALEFDVSLLHSMTRTDLFRVAYVMGACQWTIKEAEAFMKRHGYLL